jgi:hypothetical protein
MCRDHRGLALKLLSTSSAPRPRGGAHWKSKIRPLSFLLQGSALIIFALGIFLATDVVVEL